ncbi:hypothetical protein K378_03829 [Streptomyces sp. Amel2xB2]|uniref:Uncharacterized protein n=1 Tax=Streptomyces nanshensis TaxID=518642 RepID=A0A1E7KG96_9ACTN|nr:MULTISPECIES: hypothetical protein [Streptomyces]OEV02962.1 hypothetical protein AN218_33060 [Streptomyces nanshensis]RAJ62478.1 hypothetical protein K378_03829 [Streptomyces sp. Amel2xB2]
MNKRLTVTVACAVAGAMCGITAYTANATSADGDRDATPPRAAEDVRTQGAGADEICAILGIGSGAAGASKALAKGASWVGIGASIGCYWYSQGKKATPAEKRAVMLKSYKNYQAKSDLGKLDALGYYCRKDDGGGSSGGTDLAPAEPQPKAGWRTIVMKGVSYKCTATHD